MIFIDSVSRFYQCSTGAFRLGISMFFSISFRKKNAEAIKLWGILKKYISKSNFSLNKKVIYLSYDFQT